MSRKHGRPIFKILDNKYKNYHGLSFKNYLFEVKLPVKRLNYLSKEMKELMKNINTILFNKGKCL